MQPVKRIDLVVPEMLLREVTELLDRHGVGGYTVSRGLSGRGDRGVQAGDGLAGEFSNAAVLVVCSQAKVDELLEELRALLKRYGGMCLVSDAMWLRH
jgi:nitrogen regulatory protein PII